MNKLLCIFLLLASLPSHARRAAPPTYEVIVKKGESYQGVKFPVGTKVYLYTPGDAVSYVILSQEFTLSGHALKAGTNLKIYDNGVLFEIYPEVGQKIGDLTFAKGEASSVTFSKEGKLDRLYLVGAKEVQGYRFAKGSELLFHPNGKVAMGTYMEAQEKQGLNLAENSKALFYPSGQIQQITLGKESKFGELFLKNDPNPASPGETEFWPNGKLKNAVLAKPATIGGYPCGPGRISFFESGKPQTLIFGANHSVVLNSYPKDAKAGDQLFLSDDGRVVGWGGK